MMEKKNRNAICFDWDGTILDSMGDKFENFIEAILTAFDIPDEEHHPYPDTYRRMIDFCHKEFGGELRVYQFDNVVNSLCHPFDLLRLLQRLRDEPGELETSSYRREVHLYENFREELTGSDRDSFTQWVGGLAEELSKYLHAVEEPFPEFCNLRDRTARHKVFDTTYTRLNLERSKGWKAFPSSSGVIQELAVCYDLYVASSLLNPLLDDEVAKYPDIESCMMGIFGGDKSQAIRKVKASGYDKVLFVGDMPADRVAAVQNGAHFYRIHPSQGQGNLDWQKMPDHVAKVMA